MQSVEDLAAGRAVEEEQDHEQATLAPRLTKEDGVIDWSQPAAQIHNLVRGLHPWPHAFSHLHGKRYLIHRTTPLDAPAPAATPSRRLRDRCSKPQATACSSRREIAARLAVLRDPARRPASPRRPRVPRRASYRDRFGLRSIPMIAPARAAAHQALRAVHTGRADLPGALAQDAQPAVRYSGPRPRRRDRHRNAENARRARPRSWPTRASRPLDAIDPAVLDLLRAAVYQLIYLDRVPGHAVVNDTVALTRQCTASRGPPVLSTPSYGRSPAPASAPSAPASTTRVGVGRRRGPRRRARLPQHDAVTPALARGPMA